MAEEGVLQFGFLGLFALTFLSATLVPLSSEVVVGLMPALGYDPRATFIIATAGNVLGALANYLAGKHVGGSLISRYLPVKPATLGTSSRIMNRWGAPILFFSWLPFIGDPMTVVAGILRVPLSTFAFWVVLGRVFRYAVILGFVSALADAR